ncbi:hypothetical protein GmRootA79_16080 [Acidovorax sp. A79]|uniref:hypothetical protein n=1 Tax=Acidovorax sp. A79 TaxID=3056107 RepID=UPI0034E8547A
MQYIKYTYVDAITGVPVTEAPAANGPTMPVVDGLEFVWARESAYPTDAPEMFGTCPDESDAAVPGVLAVISQADFEILYADEIAAREAAASATMRITRLAFRNRFTMVEKATLELAALDEPGAPMPARQQSAMLRAYLADVAAATFIELTRQDIRDGVTLLETLGLLAVGRALEILDAPIQPIERPL